MAHSSMQHGSMTPPVGRVTGFDRIRRKAQAFYELVDRLAAKYDLDLCEDAYNRLSRLRDRYENEKRHHTLTPFQLTALRKVFEEDSTLKACSMLDRSASTVHYRSGGEPAVPLFTTQPDFYAGRSVCRRIVCWPHLHVQGAIPQSLEPAA